MIGYWLGWSMLTIFKGGLLAMSIAGAVGGVLHFDEYALLAILFIPLSIWLLYDFAYQLLVPLNGGEGGDTPMYMGSAPSCREAKEAIKKGYCIIWD